MRAHAFAALVRKDLTLFFRDRRAVLMGFAAPIAIASFFGFLFSGSSTTESAKIPVTVIDRDGSAVSQALIAGLAKESLVAVTTVAPSAEAATREAVRRGKTTIAVLLPAGFGESSGRALFGGAAKPSIGLFYDPSHSSELAVVRGLLAEHVMEAVTRDIFGGPGGKKVIAETLRDLDTFTGLSATDRGALRDLLHSADRLSSSGQERPAGSPARGGLTLPYAVSEEAITAKKGVAYNGYAHSFAGMGMQFILLASIDLGMGILLERQRGLWKRLRGAPISRHLLLAARATSAALLAFLTLLVTFGFGMVVFHIRLEGSVAGFLGVGAAYSLMAATFGLLIAAIGKTPQATRGIAALAVLLMVMLGGAWIPAFLFPAWLQKVTLALPTRWALDGLDGASWRGLGLAASLPPIGVVLAFAVAFGTLAVMRFRWEGE